MCAKTKYTVDKYVIVSEKQFNLDNSFIVRRQFI